MFATKGGETTYMAAPRTPSCVSYLPTLAGLLPLFCGLPLFLSACYFDAVVTGETNDFSGPSGLVESLGTIPVTAGVEEVAAYYDVPVDLLLVMGYISSSWTEADPHHGECTPSFGPLGLSEAQVLEAAGLTGLTAESIRRDAESGLVAGAALISELRDAHAPDAEGRFLNARWWDVVAQWIGSGNEGVDALYSWDVFATLQRGLDFSTPSGEAVVVAPYMLPGLQDIDMPEIPGTSDAREIHGYPGRARFTPASSSNYSGRSGGLAAIDSVIIHTVEGSYAGAISWFRNPGSDVSAHYVVRKSDGEVTQMVHDDKKAWHAGSYNRRSIGIEHEGHAASPGTWTDAMLESSARLGAWLSNTYNIPVNRSHFLGHSEIPGAYKSDPGAHFPWDRYLALVSCFKTGSSTCPSSSSPGSDSRPGDRGPGDDSPSGGPSDDSTGSGSGDDSTSSGGPSGPTDSATSPWIRLIRPIDGMPVGDPLEIVAAHEGGHQVEFYAGIFRINPPSTSNPAIRNVDFFAHGVRTISARLYSASGALLATDSVRAVIKERHGAVHPHALPAGGLSYRFESALEDLEEVDHITYAVDGAVIRDTESGAGRAFGPDYGMNHVFTDAGHGHLVVARAYDSQGRFVSDGTVFVDVEEEVVPECNIRSSLSCGELVYGNTANDGIATDFFDTYGDFVGSWSGPEVGYRLDVPSSGSFEVKLEYNGPITIDHDLILLQRDRGVCSEADAIEMGFTSIEFEAQPGALYTLVVDGYDGASGSYALRMNCP